MKKNLHAKINLKETVRKVAIPKINYLILKTNERIIDNTGHMTCERINIGIGERQFLDGRNGRLRENNVH